MNRRTTHTLEVVKSLLAADNPMNQISVPADLRKDLDEIDQGIRYRSTLASNLSISQAVIEISDIEMAAARRLRQLLSSHKDLVVHEIVIRGWVPHLVTWLEFEPYKFTHLDSQALNRVSAVHLEALWALTNLSASVSTSPDHLTAISRSVNLVAILVSMLTRQSDMTLSISDDLLKPIECSNRRRQRHHSSSSSVDIKHDNNNNDDDNCDTIEQIMWIIGNLSGESIPLRQSFIKSGILSPLVRIVQLMATQSLINHDEEDDDDEECMDAQTIVRIGSWALSSLCESSSSSSECLVYSHLNVLVPTLLLLLRFTEDDDILSHTCWCLSHLCDSNSIPSSSSSSSSGVNNINNHHHHSNVMSPIRTILSTPSPISSSLCKQLVHLLTHANWRVIKPALRAIGNIICAEDEMMDFTQAMIEADAVSHLKALSLHVHREIQKEACWTLSNIAAGSSSQIQAVLDCGVMTSIVSLAKGQQPGDCAISVVDHEVKSEACWVILNACSCGSDAQVEILVGFGCVSVLVELLGESTMVMMALEGLERILQVGELKNGSSSSRVNHRNHTAAAKPVTTNDRLSHLSGDGNPYAALLSSAHIEALEKHKNSSISRRASRIWKQHFVTCAICQLSYSKHSSETGFCGECKCHVCIKCDCSVFHLSYQQNLWENSKNNSKRQKKKKMKKGNNDDDDDDCDAKQQPSCLNNTREEPVEDVNSNNDFVNFLEQTGSILALAEKMNQVYDVVVVDSTNGKSIPSAPPRQGSHAVHHSGSRKHDDGMRRKSSRK